VIETLGVLVATTVATAVLHTLIPDHWLPFVLVARSEGWGARRTAAITGGAAVLHVVVSLSLGIAAHYLARGAEAAAGVGESIETVSAYLLTGFGLIYAGWFLVRGGHQHSFGMHPHHAPEQAHLPGRLHPHALESSGWQVSRSAAGRAGVAGPGTAKGRRSRALALAAIVGFNPCVLVIPYIYLAGTMGLRALVLVALSFAASTVGCMVTVVLLGLRGTARLESPFLMRYGEAVSGGLIAATGLLLILVGR
jgi:hypothetical protein